MTWGKPDMPFELFIDLPTNKQIFPIIIAIAIVVVVGLIIAVNVFSIRDKRKEKKQENIDMKLKRDKMMDKVVRREAEPTKTKNVHQIKRESRDPAVRQQQELFAQGANTPPEDEEPEEEAKEEEKEPEQKEEE